MRLHHHYHPRVASFLLAWGLLLALASPLYAQTAGSTGSDVIRTLAKERTLGEDGAAFLKDFANKDPARLADGRLLYSAARAEFEGLIEELKGNLGADRDPTATPAFQSALKDAAAKREAFVEFLKREVLPTVGNDKAGVLAGITAATALIPALADGGAKLWGEWRKASAERRDEIERKLDAQKWRAFERIGQ